VALDIEELRGSGKLCNAMCRLRLTSGRSHVLPIPYVTAGSSRNRGLQSLGLNQGPLDHVAYWVFLSMVVLPSVRVTSLKVSMGGRPTLDHWINAHQPEYAVSS
jgi:hypothetical protein